MTDARCARAARRSTETLGTEVRVADEPDPESGLLGARPAYVRRLCAANADCPWLDQYADEGDRTGHHRTTGPETAKAFPLLDVVLIGSGTTGTLVGCANHFRENQPSVAAAVDRSASPLWGTKGLLGVFGVKEEIECYLLGYHPDSENPYKGGIPEPVCRESHHHFLAFPSWRSSCTTPPISLAARWCGPPRGHRALTLGRRFGAHRGRKSAIPRQGPSRVFSHLLSP